jgi:hypothetical protein
MRLSLVGLRAIPHLVCGLGLAAPLLAPGPEVFAVELNVRAAAVVSIVRDMVGTFEKESRWS